MEKFKISVSRLRRSETEYYVIEKDMEQYEFMDIIDKLLTDEQPFVGTTINDIQRILIINEIMFYIFKYDQTLRLYINIQKVENKNKEILHFCKMNYILTNDTSNIDAIKLIISSMRKWINLNLKI